MNEDQVQQHIDRVKFEAEEAMNKLGAGFTALIRLLLILGILLLLGVARFLNLLDEQLEPRTKEVSHQWQHNL